MSVCHMNNLHRLSNYKFIIKSEELLSKIISLQSAHYWLKTWWSYNYYKKFGDCNSNFLFSYKTAEMQNYLLAHNKESKVL